MGRSIYPPPGAPKQTQRGVGAVGGNTTVDITISAVSAKARLSYLGANNPSTSSHAGVMLQLLNSTTIRASSSTVSATFSWEIVDVY